MRSTSGVGLLISVLCPLSVPHCRPMPSFSNRGGRQVFRWPLPAVVALVSFLIYLNGAFFSPYSALHIDLSINLVASRALRDGSNPYGETVLHDRAVALGSPTLLVYQTLFTSYIQPPTS